MANFDVRFTGGAALARWIDPPSETRPTRINPAPNRPHLYWRGAVDEEIELSAVVAGVVGPADSALDGELFVGWFAEHPGVAPIVTVPAGQSSVRRFTPASAGHYCYVLRRRRGGGVIVHVDVV